MEWLPSTRGEWGRRLAIAVVVVTAGVALCLWQDHYWHVRELSPSSGDFDSISGDLLFPAVPFYALAVVAILRVRVLFLACGLAAVAALTVVEFRANGTSTSSTGALVFLWSWIGGVPLATTPVIAESLLRERRNK